MMDEEDEDWVEVDLSKESIAALRIMAIAHLEHGTLPDDFTAWSITQEILTRQMDHAEMRRRLRLIEGKKGE